MKRTALILLFIISTIAAIAQDFSKKYNIPAWSPWAMGVYRGHMQLVSDGGYLLNFNYDNPNFYYGQNAIVKLNSQGLVEWAKTTNSESPGQTTETPDSAFIFPFSLVNYSPLISTMGMSKTDKNGNVKWIRLYGDSTLYGYANQTMCINNSLLLVGSTSTMVNSDYVIIKTDTAGNMLWSRTIDLAVDDTPVYIVKTYDNNLVIAGGSGSDHFALLKINVLTGAVMWAKKYPATLGADPFYLVEDAQHNLVLTGRTFSWGAGDWDIFLVKTDENGNFIFGKAYGGIYPDEGYSVHQTADGGYIICAEPESFYSSYNSQTALLKTFNDGTVSWMKLINPDTLGTFPMGSVLNADQSLSIFGINANYNVPGEITITRTDQVYNTDCNEEIVSPEAYPFIVVPDTAYSSSTWTGQRTYVLHDSLFVLTPSVFCNYQGLAEHAEKDKGFYPNPFTEKAEINIQRLAGSNCTFVLYSSSGYCVRKIEDIRDGRVTLDRIDLASGFYFYEFQRESVSLVRGKVIIR